VAVAIDGDTIVVGASGTYDDQGAAYVFVKPSSGWATTSAFNAMLTASDGGLLDFLGLSVAISGNTVVAGQPFHNDQTGPGVVYVFVKPAAGWATMTQTAELTQSVRGPYDQFGFAVAVSGNTVVAGAPQADSDAGVAYVFVEPPTGWADMTETADLTTNPGGRFGWTLGISGKQIVVGYDGSASTIPVYAEPESGWTWRLAELNPAPQPAEHHAAPSSAAQPTATRSAADRRVRVGGRGLLTADQTPRDKCAREARPSISPA